MTEVLGGIGELDFARYVGPGDLVAWGQACAEPQSLTETLLAQRSEIGDFRCWLGVPVTDTARPEHGDRVRFVSYSGAGANRALLAAGVLDVVPAHYSTYPWLLTDGPLHADVVLLQVPPAGADGTFSLGMAGDYLRAAVDTARVVIAEVNDQVPRTCGPRRLTETDIDVLVPTSRPPAAAPVRAPSAVTEQVAAHVASVVPDGATLQFGVGAMPDAALAKMTGHIGLRVHSGLIGDGVVPLVESGVIEPPLVTGFLMGTQRLFGFVDGNPAVELHETSHTHDPELLAGLPNLVAINSAIEVDLTGAVNAEVAGGEYVGAVGGAMDFLRAAARAPGGLPIVALPSTARGRSRIVRELAGPVSTSRADAGLIITEHGIADLRGATLRERRERMLAIADPEHRAALSG